MAAFRIVPCLDVAGGSVVKGVRFRQLRVMGDPVLFAQRYREEGADELVFLDIAASQEGRGTMVRVVQRVAEVLDIPFCVGGGLRTLRDAVALIHAGADKVAVNSAAVADPDLLRVLAQELGSQAVVLAVDARRTGSGWEVVTHGGHRYTGKEVTSWVREAVERGAGEILLTSIDCDGTGEGFDTALIAAVRQVVDVPVVASGGGASWQHFLAAYRAGADAGLAATIFHEGKVSLPELKRQLAEAGVPVRLEAVV
ncbi:MAG: imidazole glycerol phosphate synthase subunit HisF [Thermoanaerobaculaceae bacterium]